MMWHVDVWQGGGVARGCCNSTQTTASIADCTGSGSMGHRRSWNQCTDIGSCAGGVETSGLDNCNTCHGRVSLADPVPAALGAAKRWGMNFVCSEHGNSWNTKFLSGQLRL